MNWLAKRALAVFGLAVLCGAAAALIWPGDPGGAPLSGGHWLGLFLIGLGSVLIVIAAVLTVISLVGDTWKAGRFNLNRYLDKE